jgi:hypothetical protein
MPERVSRTGKAARKNINADGKEEVKSYKSACAGTMSGTLWLMLNEAGNRR